MNATIDSLAVGAPSRLVAETRVDFRASAMDVLERLVDHGATSLDIDMTATEEVDASGLGTLVVVQKRARERSIGTRLLGARPTVRALLATTRLEGLFQFE